MISLLGEVINILLYVSVVILVTGIGVFLLKDIPQKIYLNFVYFSTFLFFELISNIVQETNLFLFPIASFLHFAFLIYFYFKNFLNINAKKALLIIIIGTIPMIFSLLSGYTTLDFQSYDRAIYSFAITLLSLYYFYLMLNEDTKVNKASILFNSAVLLFFSIDTFLAVGMNYLVNANMVFVAWFWFFRAAFLQFYYASLIYYSWQNGKTP